MMTRWTIDRVDASGEVKRDYSIMLLSLREARVEIARLEALAVKRQSGATYALRRVRF